jgi:hypothetical protein
VHAGALHYHKITCILELDWIKFIICIIDL